MDKKILVAASALTLALGGCASYEPRDASELRSGIDSVAADSWGTCMEETHLTAVNLEVARGYLQNIEDDPQYSGWWHVEEGKKAAAKAADHKAKAAAACGSLWEPQIAALEIAVADLEARVENLERIRREILQGVTFHTGSARLTEMSSSVLDAVANKLVNSPVDVEIAGYASNTGDPDFNLKLSQQRADAVRDYLIRQGADGSRITAKGYGIADPVASNDTADGRRRNQRVELHPASGPYSK